MPICNGKAITECSTIKSGASYLIWRVGGATKTDRLEDSATKSSLLASAGEAPVTYFKRQGGGGGGGFWGFSSDNFEGVRSHSICTIPYLVPLRTPAFRDQAVRTHCPGGGKLSGQFVHAHHDLSVRLDSRITFSSTTVDRFFPMMSSFSSGMA